jgi:hypothetical protein
MAALFVHPSCQTLGPTNVNSTVRSVCLRFSSLCLLRRARARHDLSLPMVPASNRNSVRNRGCISRAERCLFGSCTSQLSSYIGRVRPMVRNLFLSSVRFKPRVHTGSRPWGSHSASRHLRRSIIFEYHATQISPCLRAHSAAVE